MGSDAVPPGDREPVIPTARPSPNCGPRRNGARPDMVLLHYTAMKSTEAALDRLCNPDVEVSAHYLISCEGTLNQLVDETDRAWHAGAGQWGDVTDINSRSIGIELDNPGDQPFTAPLMATLEALLPRILARWSIPPERVLAHSDTAPTRKCDPGPRFDWQRLVRQGLSVWPEGVDLAAHADLKTFASSAHRFGYAADLSPDIVLCAFRLRFRPWASGPVDATDLCLIADLAARFPVDAGRPGA